MTGLGSSRRGLSQMSARRTPGPETRGARGALPAGTVAATSGGRGPGLRDPDREERRLRADRRAWDAGGGGPAVPPWERADRGAGVCGGVCQALRGLADGGDCPGGVAPAAATSSSLWARHARSPTKSAAAMRSNCSSADDEKTGRDQEPKKPAGPLELTPVTCRTQVGHASMQCLSCG